MSRPRWGQYIGDDVPLSPLIYSLYHHALVAPFHSAVHFPFSSELFSLFLSLIIFSHRSIRFFRLDLRSSKTHHEVLNSLRLLCPGGICERSYYCLEHLCQRC